MVIVRNVIVKRININFYFVVIVSAASIHVDAAVEVTMSVGRGWRRP